MSLFSTKIPVGLSQVLNSLPKKGVFVQSIVFDKETSTVTVTWDCPRFHSGLSVAVEYPLEELGRKRLPKGVKDKTRPEPPSEVKNSPQVNVEPKQAIPQPSYITTLEAFEAAKKEGALEFQGVEPVWKPVVRDQQFVDGFFYRKLAVV